MIVAPHAGAWIEIIDYLVGRSDNPSLLTRERGLKFLVSYTYHHPLVAPHAGAWIEIGDKSPLSLLFQVAPHAGAWIEMQRPRGVRRKRLVAPHAGAWIEIMACSRCTLAVASLLTRERGLKFDFAYCFAAFSVSLLTRERGLKYPHKLICSAGSKSLLTRERGLKFGCFVIPYIGRKVAPHAGAWIEIPSSRSKTR